uniref:butyrophilin-like protein 2 isoform X2 n=1 Tax=Solea senegalensis TaxID=28829 RepID=UPI001CD8E334|nr:butyrophilin-like protein 2 isoform X2 [Solea senegalensis]
MDIEKWPHLSTENTLVFVLVCSLVCFGATHQDETNGVSRTYVKEGEDAVLHCSSVESLENTVVDWENQNKKEVCLYDRGRHCEDRRDNQDEQYKGRVSLFYDELMNGNASLILSDTRIEDTGTYTCTLPHLSSGIQRSTIELIVGVSRTYVTEGENAVLHCSSVESLENTVVDWKNQNKEVFLYDGGWHYENGLYGQDEQYMGRASLFYNELKNGNASLILNNTRIEDTGNYTCILPRLSSGIQRSTVELIVGVSRTYVTEGEDAVLHCSSVESLENTVVDWKNQNKEVFLYDRGWHYENGLHGQDEQYMGRASLFYDELKNGNASLILINTRIEDTGTYTCIFPHLSSGIQRSTVELIVGVSRTYVKEGEDVVLHCSSGDNQSLKDSLISWKNINGKDLFLYELGHHTEDGWCCQDEQYRGRVSLFYDQLKNGNASMILRDTRIEDTGIYTCDLPGLSSGRQIFAMELIVERVLRNRIGLEKGASQAPVLKMVNVTEAGVELQCVVRGSSSKPSVEWQTCEGTSLNSEEPLVSETRGRYDTTLLVTVNETKTNCFRCVVKQEDIYHRIDTNIIVSEKLYEKKSSHDTQSSHSTVVLVGMFFAGVFTLVLLQLVLYLIFTRRRIRRSMEMMNVISSNMTSDQNIGNRITDTKNIRNDTVKTEEETEKEKRMPSDTSASASDPGAKRRKKSDFEYSKCRI